MIEFEKLEQIRTAEIGQSGVQKIDTLECGNSAVHDSKNNNYKGYQRKKNSYQGRTYPPGYLDKLYANYIPPDDRIKDYKETNGITDLNDLIENKD